MNDKYYTSYEALEVLKISKPTLYKLVKKGVIRRRRMSGMRKFLYNKADVQAVIEGNIIESETGMVDWTGIKEEEEGG